MAWSKKADKAAPEEILDGDLRRAIDRKIKAALKKTPEAGDLKALELAMKWVAIQHRIDESEGWGKGLPDLDGAHANNGGDA